MGWSESEPVRLRIYKWDDITLSDFRTSSCLATLSYGWVLILILTSVGAFAADVFTAVNLLAFDRFAGQVKPSIPFKVSKWIFSACILVSIALLVFEWIRAWRIIRKNSIVDSYLDPLAAKVQAVRDSKGWRRFLVFTRLTKSKKGADYVALFAYFQFKGALRFVLVKGPILVVNAVTLWSVAQAEMDSTLKEKKDESVVTMFIQNIKTLATLPDKIQVVIYFTMLYTLLIWVIDVLCLLIAIFLYLTFLWHYIPDSSCGLSGHCRMKINNRVERIAEERAQRVIRKEAKKRKGGKKSYDDGGTLKTAASFSTAETYYTSSSSTPYDKTNASTPHVPDFDPDGMHLRKEYDRSAYQSPKISPSPFEDSADVEKGPFSPPTQWPNGHGGREPVSKSPYVQSGAFDGRTDNVGRGHGHGPQRSFTIANEPGVERALQHASSMNESRFNPPARSMTAPVSSTHEPVSFRPRTPYEEYPPQDDDSTIDLHQQDQIQLPTQAVLRDDRRTDYNPFKTSAESDVTFFDHLPASLKPANSNGPRSHSPANRALPPPPRSYTADPEMQSQSRQIQISTDSIPRSHTAHPTGMEPAVDGYYNPAPPPGAAAVAYEATNYSPSILQPPSVLSGYEHTMDDSSFYDDQSFLPPTYVLAGPYQRASRLSTILSSGLQTPSASFTEGGPRMTNQQNHQQFSSPDYSNPVRFHLPRSATAPIPETAEEPTYDHANVSLSVRGRRNWPMGPGTSREI